MVSAPAVAQQGPTEAQTFAPFADDRQGQLFVADAQQEPPPRPARRPVGRPKLKPPPMLLLLTVVPNIDVIETMRGLGRTDAEIAERLGISRSQVTNISNGQYGPSRDVVQRVLKLAKAA